MAGLRMICRMYGGMQVNDVKWLWDYAADEPVMAKDMPEGGERWKASEKAKWAEIASYKDDPDHAG